MHGKIQHIFSVLVTSTATVNMLEPFETEEIVEFISPRFIEKVENVHIMDGEKLVLNAKVHGVPIPKVEWLHNGDTIAESKDIFTQQDNSGQCTLTIKEVFPEDAGEYVCVAKNKIGEAFSRGIVTVDGKKTHFPITFNLLSNLSQLMSTYKILK